MGSRIDYYFDIDRNATSFTLNADYHIDPAFSPRTEYEFTYRDDDGRLLESLTGTAGSTTSVSDSFVFDTGAGVAQTRLQFQAADANDGYGFYYYWHVFDGAREDAAVSISATNDTDILFGGSGNDALRGLGDDDWLDGGFGIDRMYGGSGDDTYVVDNARDRAIEAQRGGDDAVRSSVSYTLATTANVETLDLTGTRDTSATGNTLDNTLAGNRGDNRLVGGIGADHLFGEGGADTFQYRAINESTVSNAGRDVIEDFRRAQGDEIDLHLIDADATSAGNQAFSFIGSQAFGHEAGQLRAVYAGANTVVSGDTNGDGRADFAITLRGHIALGSGDFDL